MSERYDMSQFEAQFELDPSGEERLSKRMNNDTFDRLAFLNDRIHDFDGLIDLRTLDNLSLEEKLVHINSILALIRKLERKYLDKRGPIEAQITWNKRNNRVDQQRREELERERKRLLDELAARERFLAQRNLLFESTANKPWAVGVNGKRALPHQLEGAHRLVSAKRGILGDKPGLGKTLEAIMTIDMLRAEGKGQKVLIFTPKPVLKDFERAFQTWTDPTLVHVLNQTVKGVKTEILHSVKYIPQIIVITNYEVWRKDKSIHQKLIECGFDTVIFDEAHILKEEKSKVFIDIRELVYAENKCPKCGHDKFAQRGLWDKICTACEWAQENNGDFCSVKNVYPMTGTPMLNKPAELFTLLNLIDREGFPSRKAFLDDYCTKEYDHRTEKYYYTFGSGGSERLLKRLGMKYTARTRESAGVVMPPQEVKHHWLELDPEKYPRQHRFIQILRDKARLAFAEGVELSQPEILAWYTRMRQAASWPDGIQIKGCAHNPPCEDEWGNPGECHNPTVIFPPPGAPPIGESIMMDTAEEITFEAVEDGDRIVVFSHFKSVIAELERRCQQQGLRVAKIVGGIPDHLRQSYVDDFNTNHTKVGEHEYDVLICQYKTASVGLNLNGAQQLLMIEREWNPGKEEQTMDRIRRLDSTYDSIVHVLHCAGTATDLIDAIQDQKLAMIEGFQADVDLLEAMRKFLEG
jgi:SNF2 family DNA or RNA helicase